MMGINRYQVKAFFKTTLIHIFLASVAVTCLFPLFWMFRSALMTNQTVFTDKSLIPHEIHFSNFAQAWMEGSFGTYFLNSVFYTFSVVTGIVFIASLAAYAFSRLQFPGRRILFAVFLGAMMIPLPGSFVPLVAIMNKLRLANTPYGYILCMINVGLSFSIYILKTFFDKMPADLEDAARMDGCNKLGIWWNVALPLARPAIAVVIVFNALNVWNEYILATLLLNEKSLMPLQRGLMVFQGAHSVDYPLLMAGLTIAAMPIILVYLFMQRHFVQGLTSGAVVG